MDPEARKVYWLQDHLFIRRSNYDGSNVETLYEDEAIGDRSHLAIDTQTDELFWTSLNDASISRATLDGTSNQRWIEGLSSSPFGITLVPLAVEAPALQVGAANEIQFTVTWTQPSPDWQLESKTEINSGSWSAVPLNDITLDGTEATATLDSTLPQLFLRLHNTAENP